MMPDQFEEIEQQAQRNVQAFLKLIRWAEFYPHGGVSEGDYTTQYGGGHFTSLADHPRTAVTRWRHTSTAAGAYMITEEAWDEFKDKLNLSDFGIRSQDAVAVEMIREAKALEDVRAGHVEDAIKNKKVRKRWSSLPGASQAQQKMTLAAALEKFKEFQAQEL